MGCACGCLAIADLVIKVNSSPELNFHQNKRFLPFRFSAAHHDLRWNFQVIHEDRTKLEAGVAEQKVIALDEIPAETKFPLLRSPQVRASLESALSSTKWAAIEAHPQALAILDFKRNQADIYLAQAHVAESAKRIVSAAMLKPFLPNFDALMLHAAAVVRHGRAAVFLAPDEGGKTTAARLSPVGTILCDDQVIVRRSRGRFRVWGTPWGLHVDPRTNAPLAGLFLLKKGKRFSLAPLPARELIPFIWGEIQNPLAILPKPLKKKAFGIICDIATSAPAYKVSFTREHMDWEALDEAMNGSA